MDKKQTGLNLGRQLKAFIDILEQLDNIGEDQNIDFRNEYFLQTIEKGFMHGYGMIYFELIRKSPKKKQEQQVKRLM